MSKPAFKIELKSIRTNERFSRETNCFTADVWIDGEKIAYAENDGNGGCTFINAYEGKVEKLREIEAWAKAQPKIKSESLDFEFDSSLDYIVDDMIEKHIIEKFAKNNERKMANDMKKGLCTRGAKHDEGSYSIITWKGHTIESLLAMPKGIEAVQNAVNKALAAGDTILNTNLKGIKI